MRKLGMNELRKEYLDFFGSKKNHTVLKSFSLIPEDDESLLLINAGMAPLKKYFTGEKKMKNNRATSSQRCIRTGDIERVGITERHGTFFEMLGNFSFGDYFKREAIHWAYEFLTVNLEIDKNLLWVSVYENDDEAFDIWHDEIGIAKDRILRFGKEDNFWELEVGPCGPDSEIFVDRGIEKAVDENDNKPGNDDSDRFMEVWNLVFTQFNKNANKEYIPLAHPNIDTGMGLERMAMVLQNKDNIFEVDVNQNIIKEIEELSNKKYKENKKDDISIRVIADHAKAMTFMVSDGIQPSNEKRGYVLRRLIRRAFRHGKLLGIEGEFLSSIVDCVIDSYKVEYDELTKNREKIINIIKKEEENFQKTIDSGLDILNSYIKELKENNKDILRGKDAFKLYDTYGFPLDLTKEILDENDLKVDTKEFDEYMENQRNLARNARKSDAGWSLESINVDEFKQTEFVGYENFEINANIIGLFDNKEKVNFIKKGHKGIIVSDKTSFYAEGGGQVADTGFIITDDAKARVYNVQKKKDVILHYVEVEEGKLESCNALFKVNKQRRLDITRNHTATHLLDQALRNLLSDEVKQAGSLVDEYKLRFDFTYPNALTKDEIKKIEDEVNEKIREQLPVKKEIMSYKESEKLGAIGLFEDKYKDMVRVVSVSDYSKELCGGCHVNNSSEILMFKIIQESSAASGIRRIEAITGKKVYEYLNKNIEIISLISDELKTNPKNILSRAKSLNEEIKELKDDIQKLKEFNEKDICKDIESEVEDINGINLLVHKFDNEDLDTLRNFENRIKDKYKDLIIVFATVKDNKIIFTASVSDSLTDKYNAGKIVKEVSKITGGNGGGKKNFAQAGGKDISKLDEALEKVYDLI
ncbi:MAG: alanine--tRNA ligase [Anaerococcus vaginalis]|uniref:alanine--tRNA ligase n=1 Tax=Anaerococcus vaginalis TaxID=33037 RepID=UPI001DBF6D5D|nr:alanine--tRNA ligase [Anaerococcus vaginalis]MBS4888499.1 alanine--tRNA ligase [Anaerococcus vaginalis]MDU4447472.1 alanine--tRNA ligase [Anaerococcus vaginalis]MDU6181042.1 alanine--tRNA ligase [Anaerococcus vaginalis]MDU7432116.1 alanine--tRNA ligase [Anaerococcus vaginalis]